MFSQGNRQLRFTPQKGHCVCYGPGILGKTGEWPGGRDRRRVRKLMQ